ncbi:hypothetical protein Tco_1285122 [Tanacetum coccineum]
MTNVLSRLEFVLAWTLRSPQSANDQKRNGRTTFIEKARLLLSTKAPSKFKLFCNVGELVSIRIKETETGFSKVKPALLIYLDLSLIAYVLVQLLLRMSSDTKRLGQINGNNKRGKMMEKHVTTVTEIGCPSGGVVSVSQQVLSPSYD